jgi:hypothetical protein
VKKVGVVRYSVSQLPVREVKEEEDFHFLPRLFSTLRRPLALWVKRVEDLARKLGLKAVEALFIGNLIRADNSRDSA